MKTMEELRHRISNVEDVQSIVSTMKTMAAVHIRQYDAAADAMAEYLRTVQLGFHVLLQDRAIPQDITSSNEPSGAIIFGSDQGLCGQFNEEIARYALSNMNETKDSTAWRIIVVGNRVSRQLEEPDLAVETEFRVPTTVAAITTLLQELMPHIERWRSHGTGRIVVYFNSRTSIATYAPEQYQLFPLSSGYLEHCKSMPWSSRGLPTYSMSWNDLLSSVVRQYLFVGLYRACAESRASENASRIASMQSAGKNVERRLTELRTEFNETRQAAITEEILEIATGVEALSGS